MAFCSSCGADVGGAAVCPKCGAAQPAQATPIYSGNPSSSRVIQTSGIDENVAGLLCYILGWVTGLIFLLIDKRPFVKFHAAQSIFFSIAIFVLYFGASVVLGVFRVMGLGFMIAMVIPFLGLLVFVVSIFLMYKAYQHEMYMLPVIGGIAKSMSEKSF